MMRQRVIFFVIGAVTGILTVLVGSLSPLILTIGVGPLFCCAALVGIYFTRSWRFLPTEPWRILSAVILSTSVYVLALLAFSIVVGYSPRFLGASQSDDIVQFRVDVWLGLLVATFVASIGIESVVAILTGKWKTLIPATFPLPERLQF